MLSAPDLAIQPLNGIGRLQLVPDWLRQRRYHLSASSSGTLSLSSALGARVSNSRIIGERLPLFLDEVLVNWDGTRLENGLILLKDIAAQRQVFLFTCHQWLIDRLLSITSVQIIELG